jgi:hypothetical protein
MVVLDVACAFQVRRFQVECCGDERFVKARRVNAKNFFAELKRRNAYKGDPFVAKASSPKDGSTR